MTPTATGTVTEIVTADLPRALAFYRLVGLPVPEGQDDAPHVEVELPGGGKLAFDPEATIRSFKPGWAPTPGAGRMAIAFGFARPAEVDEVHAALAAAGHHSELDPFDAPWGQRYATVLDPDGNGVDLFAAL